MRRYDLEDVSKLWAYGGPNNQMVEYRDGAWVRYEDAQARIAKLEAAAREARDMLSRIRKATGIVVHSNPESCEGCGCLMLSAEEAVAAMRRSYDAEVEDLRERIAELEAAIRSWGEFNRGAHQSYINHPQIRPLWDLAQGLHRVDPKTPQG